MVHRIVIVAVFALLVVSALPGCRAEAEVDPDGRVTTPVPAAR